jgi:hypothetical protein
VDGSLRGGIGIIARVAVPDQALLNAARALSCDRITGEVATALRDAGVPAILLKGPSIARWLYPAGGRAYADSDLLVPSSEFSRAGQVLGSLGFTEVLEGFHPFERTRGQPAAETTFARQSVRYPGLDGRVDLHRNLPRLGAPDDLLWQAFSSGAQTALVGGVEVRVPGRAALALHVVLHAVQHKFQGHTDEDLRRALMVMSADDWHPVADLAYRLGAADILGYGLGHHEAGAGIVNRLGLPSLPRADRRVWGMSVPRGSVSLTEFWSAPGLRAKATWIRWTLLPSAAKVRYVFVLPGAPRHLLLGAYVRYWRNLARGLGPGALAAARVIRNHRRPATGGSEESDRR